MEEEEKEGEEEEKEGEEEEEEEENDEEKDQDAEGGTDPGSKEDGQSPADGFLGEWPFEIAAAFVQIPTEV